MGRRPTTRFYNPMGRLHVSLTNTTDDDGGASKTKEMLELIFYVKDLKVRAVSLEIDGVKHCTADIRHTYGESLNIVISKGTVSSSEIGNLHETMAKSVELSLLDTIELNIEPGNWSTDRESIQHILVTSDQFGTVLDFTEV